jgi:hypothetical protein
MVENFLFNVFQIFWDTVVSNFVFFAWGCLFLALLWSSDISAVGETFFVNKSVNFSVVQSSWDVTSLTLVVDGLIASQWSLRGQQWEWKFAGFAPSVSDGSNWSNCVW